MLRPATPLAVLLFAAFALQLVTVISTPIVKGIELANFDGTTFGVFGFCTGNSCSSIGIGYSTSQEGSSSNGFTLGGPTTRHALTAILVVHPVAALFTLIIFVMSVATHFHGPSHSTRFLLAVILLILPTFILSLLAFLVDILLFIPHPGWGVWLMLAATFIIAVSGVLMCAMRRTLVSRKSRKDRVANNAEMSGENFYSRQAAEANAPRASSPPPLPQNRVGPMVNGTPGGDNLPSFATYDSKPRMSGEDDRTPLNNLSRTGTSMTGDGMERYGGGRGGMITQGRGGRGYGPQRDPYGNPMPPPGYPYGAPGSGRGSPVRGRGGYPPPRGAYGRGGPYGGRGGPGMPMGAAMAGGAMAGAMMGRGGPRQPPDGDSYPPGSGRGAPSPYGAGYANAQSPYGRRPSDPRYGPNQSPGPPPGRGGYGYGGPYNGQHPPSHESLPRAESPPPLPGEERDMDPNVIGQAIEMTPNTSPPYGQQPHPLSDSESEGDRPRNKSGQSASSAYSSQRNDSYGRPWVNVPGRQGTPPMPQDLQASSARRSPPRVMNSNTPPPQRARVNSGDHYYEDVDVRFMREQQVTPPPPTTGMPPPSTGLPMPTSLMPGTAAVRPHPLEQQPSYDSVQEGPKSEASNFTSISQRGVNPNWDGGGAYGGGYAGGEYGYGGVPRRGPGPPQQRDFGLSNNPDFEIPGAGPNRRGGRGMGR